MSPGVSGTLGRRGRVSEAEPSAEQVQYLEEAVRALRAERWVLMDKIEALEIKLERAKRL